MPQSPQPPAAPNGGIYPKFIQSPRALAGQQYGRSGLQYFMPGWIKRDFLPQLQGQALFKTYTEMGDNDAYVGAALSAFAVFIRRAHWKVDAVDDANKDNGSAEFLQECMADMTHSWQTIIATAARAVPQYGFLPLEIVYKERAGDHEDERMSSQYDDGLIGWSNLAYRAPDSVFHWDYDPQDVTRLLGFTQLAAPDYKTTFIPIQKILLLRSDPGKDSPEGRSVLRSAWRSWRTKKYLEDYRNIIIERGGAGIPWAEVPGNICNAPFIDPSTPEAESALASYNSLVETLTNITTDAQKWIITPQVWDQNGNPTIKIGFLQPSTNGDIVNHITSSIEAEAKAVLMSTFTEFIALGMGGTGSLALSRDKTDNFTLAVEANLQSFQESINNQAVRRLFALNPHFEFEKGAPRPRIVYDPIVPIATQDVVAILSLFEKTGWDLSQQRGIRDTIIDNLGLPNYVEDETKDLLQEHGDSPIESLLDGQSAIDAILGHNVHKSAHNTRRGRTQEVSPYLEKNVKDASGHEHDDLGRFTGPGRSGSANGKGNKTSRSKKPPMSKPAENTGIKAEHTGSKSSYVSSDGKTEFHVEQKDGKRILTSAKLGRPDDVENIITQLAEKGPVSISLEMKRRYDNLSSALVNAKFRTKKIELDHSTDGTTTISMKAAKKPHQQRKERHTAVDLGDLPKEFLGRKLSDDEVVALRYSSNIERDIDRGYSFGEIGASPCETEEEAWEEWPGAHDIVYSEELGGYMLTEPGLSLLSAEWGETVEQAIPAAVENAATWVAGGTYGAAEVPLYILIGKPGEFDSNGYPTMKRVTDYHRIKPPWKKK